MKKEKVSIVRISDYSDTTGAINVAVNMVGGFEGLIKSHQEILIKPNLQRTNNQYPGLNTSKEVIRSVVKLAKILCENVTICEADATSGTAEKAFSGGWYDLAEESGAGILNASKDKKTTIRVPRPLHFKDIEISERVHKGFRISVPVMKVARGIGVSLSMKNMFGLLPGRWKAKYHIWPGIPKTLIDTNQVIYPHFVIVDGTVGLEGKGGPISGKPIHLGIIMAGRDPVAVDTVASMIMGFEPGEIPFLQAASEAGIGVSDINSIEVMGNSIEEVKMPFERADGKKGKI